MERTRPPIIIAECLPQVRFRTFFESRGCTVYSVGDAFPSGSPDPAVLAAAEARAAIVVTSDAHRRTLLAQVHGHQGRVKQAGRILFDCDHHHHVAMRRLEELIDDIEREIEIASASSRRLLLRITANRFSTER